MPIRSLRAVAGDLRAALHDRMRAAAYRSTLGLLDPPPSIEDAAAEAPPWIVSIQYDAPAHSRYRWHTATGVLIAPQAVLTCAHIFSQAAQAPGTIPIADKKFTAHVGGAGLDDGAALGITDVHLHPGFEPVAGTHDLAIAVVDRPEAGPPLPLCSIPADVGDTVTVLGWPRGRDGSGTLTRVYTTLIDRRIGGRPEMLCVANLPAPDSLGPGYSGGPVIKAERGGQDGLLGILSSDADMNYLRGAAQPGRVVDLAAETAFIQDVLRGVRS